MKNPLTKKLRMTPEIITNPNCYLITKSLVKSVNMRRGYEIKRIMISLNISLKFSRFSLKGLINPIYNN